MNGRHLGKTGLLLGLFVLDLLAASCGILDPEDVDRIRVANRTEAPLFIQVWDLETSYLVDPAPFFTLDPSMHPILEPGDSRVFKTEDVQGDYESGNGVGIFVFEIQEDLAYFRTVLQVTGRQLRERDGRVRIQAF